MVGKYETRIQALADMVLADYGNERVIDRLEMFTQPDRQIIEELIGKLLRLVFPGYYRDYVYRIYNPRNNLSALIEDVAFHLNRQIAIALRGSEQVSEEDAETAAEDITAAFLERLPEIRDYVETLTTAILRLPAKRRSSSPIPACMPSPSIAWRTRCIN